MKYMQSVEMYFFDEGEETSRNQAYVQMDWATTSPTVRCQIIIMRDCQRCNQSRLEVRHNYVADDFISQSCDAVVITTHTLTFILPLIE